MEEIWKDVVGFEGLYKVSNLGNVKSINYRGHGFARLLIPKVNNCGRLWVELRNSGVKKQMLIHRLVGEAFIPNPQNLPQINHKDENPKNNNVENLEWCTGLYNIRYTHDRHPERAKKPRVLKNRPMRTRKIVQLSIDGKPIKTWENSRIIFRETGMHQWSITQCCDGVRKKAYGFKWQYAT